MKLFKRRGGDGGNGGLLKTREQHSGPTVSEQQRPIVGAAMCSKFHPICTERRGQEIHSVLPRPALPFHGDGGKSENTNHALSRGGGERRELLQETLKITEVQAASVRLRSGKSASFVYTDAPASAGGETPRPERPGMSFLVWRSAQEVRGEDRRHLCL